MGFPMAAAALFLSLAALAASFGHGPLRRLRGADRWALAAAFAIIVLSLWSLALVRCHRFSPWSVGALMAASAGGVWLSAGRRWTREPWTDAMPLARGRAGILAATLAVLGCLYGFFPTYFVLGGQDPGLYLVFAARIAKTGGLDLDLPWLRSFWVAHPQGFALGYPGVYSFVPLQLSTDPSRLSPQFMHLFPALAANAWTFSGLEGVVRTNAALAVIELWVGFAFVRRLGGFAAGLAFVIAVGLNPAFIWGARMTLSETLCGLMTLTGLLVLYDAVETGSKRFAAVAGAVLGLGVLARLDSALAVLALLGLSAASLGDRRQAQLARAAASAYLVTSVLGFVDGRINAPFYFQTLVQRDHLDWLVAASTLGAIGSIALTFLPDRLVARFRPEPRWARRIAVAALVLVAIWMAVALSMPPWLDDRRGGHSARELGWYVTPIAWPLMLLGFAFASRAAPARTLPLMVFALGSLAVFTMGSRIMPVHIYASRRWLPQVIPTMAALSAVAVVRLAVLAPRWRIPGRLVLVALAGCYLVPALAFARPFLFRTMLRGLPAAYAAAAHQARALHLELPLATANPNIASVLTYVYDLPTVLLGGPSLYGLDDAKARALLVRGDLAGVSAIGIEPFELGNAPLRYGTFQGDFLEVVQGRKPRDVLPFPVPFDLGLIGSWATPIEVPAAHQRLVTEVGERLADGSIRATGVAGLLQGGPCMALEAGRYRVDWIGRVIDAASGDAQQRTVEVTSQAARRVLASAPLRIAPTGPSETWLSGLNFSVEHPLTCVDFRLRVAATDNMVLTRLRLTRSASARGGTPIGRGP